jgi:hypothetical protein
MSWRRGSNFVRALEKVLVRSMVLCIKFSDEVVKGRVK